MKWEEIVILVFSILFLGCEKDYHSSCFSAGILDAAKKDSKYTRTTPPNPALSLKYFRKACDEGNLAEACHMYSGYFIKGLKDVCSKNMEEAFKYSLKGRNYSHNRTRLKSTLYFFSL